jgi:membrane protein
MQAPNLPRWLAEFGQVFVYTGRRFLRDGGLQTASALSYSSLLALVPLITISFALLAAFDAFEQVRADLHKMLFEAFPGDISVTVSDQFTTFIDNANRMTGVGIAGLGVVAVLLLNTITGGLNTIWRVSEPRPLVLRVLVYWALLTLGPLLLGASLSLSSYAFAVVQWSGVKDYTPTFITARFLPFVLAVVGFSLLFLVVPNRAVAPKHAIFGAVFTAFLMELLKSGFGYYLRHFPTYQVIYGALAAIPIFLLWMYLSWAAVIFGAELAAALPEWRVAQRRLRRGGEPGAELALALSLLVRLRAANRDGRVMRERALARGLPATLTELDHVLRALRRARIVARSGGRWLLSRDLAMVSLGDLVQVLGLSFEPGEGWPERVGEVLGELSASGEEVRARSLEQLLPVPNPQAA